MFEPSRKDFLVTIWLDGAFLLAGAVANLIVLILAIILHFNQNTRRMLQRQSLYLLLWIQGGCVLFSTGFLIQLFLIDLVIKGPTAWCPATMALAMPAKNFVSFLLALIAVNLQLVIVHGINTTSWTRWYLGGAALLAVIIQIPSLVYGVWGWDALTGGCWVTYADEWQRFGWEVGTTYGWMLLSALVALVATGAVVVRLVRQKLATRRAFRQSLLADDHLVRRAAIRVVWYPVVLVISSAIELAGDLTVDVPPAGWNNLSEYVGWTVGGVVVGLMPLVLAALTIFVDPSFSHAVRMLLFPSNTPLASVDSDATLTIGTFPAPKRKPSDLDTDMESQYAGNPADTLGPATNAPHATGEETAAGGCYDASRQASDMPRPKSERMSRLVTMDAM